MKAGWYERDGLWFLFRWRGTPRRLCCAYSSAEPSGTYQVRGPLPEGVPTPNVYVLTFF